VSIVVIPVNHYDGRRNVHRAGTLWLARWLPSGLPGGAEVWTTRMRYRQWYIFGRQMDEAKETFIL